MRLDSYGLECKQTRGQRGKETFLRDATKTYFDLKGISL
jgi:hypothetical protein